MLKDVFAAKGLTYRQAEVAELVARGLTNKEVAAETLVDIKTVKFHLTNIYKKLGLKSRHQLIIWSLPHLNVDSRAKNETPAARFQPAQLGLPEE